MSNLSDAAETLVLQWLMTTGTPTRPTTWFVALHTADPTEAGTTGEISGLGYARQAAAFSVTGDTASNTGALAFGPNVTTNWGTITHLSIWTLVSGGVCLWKGAISAPVAIAVNDTLTFAIGDIDLMAA